MLPVDLQWTVLREQQMDIAREVAQERLARSLYTQNKAAKFGIVRDFMRTRFARKQRMQQVQPAPCCS